MAPAVAGMVLIFIVVLWWFIDAFLIPGMVNRFNETLRDKYTAEVIARRQRETLGQKY